MVSLRPTLALLTLLVLGSSACAPVPKPYATQAEPHSAHTASQIPNDTQRDGIARAKLHQRVYVDGPYVTPLEVIKDSRCPVPLQCYVAGDLHVRVRVHLGSRDEDIVLKNNEPVHVADGNLRLVEATPERQVQADTTNAQPIAPQAYQFGFRFMGGY